MAEKEEVLTTALAGVLLLKYDRYTIIDEYKDSKECKTFMDIHDV